MLIVARVTANATVWAQPLWRHYPHCCPRCCDAPRAGLVCHCSSLLAHDWHKSGRHLRAPELLQGERVMLTIATLSAASMASTLPAASQFMWIIFPYTCLLVLVMGTLYRYQFDQLGWGSKSSELLEKRMLTVGSALFHWGILSVFVGHVLGLLVPIEVYNALGISSELYHAAAIILGGLSGLVALAGISILLYRRIANVRVRMNSDFSDYLADGLLWIVTFLGDCVTLGYNLIYGPYEYRTTIGPWIRSLITLHPNATYMVGVPTLFQAHIALAFLLFGVSPFTRLIHIYSIPVAFVLRAPLQYRTRAAFPHASRGVGAAPALPPTPSGPALAVLESVGAGPDGAELDASGPSHR